MAELHLVQDLGLVLLVAGAGAWFCQWIRVPVVIGYLLAGILIGPHAVSQALIPDRDRIQSLAHFGLVFLIFGAGHGLSLQRLRKIGLPPILTTLLIAIFVLLGCRWIGTALGWPDEQSLLLAAILMVSSSSIAGKSLREAKQLNTFFGQTAVSVSMLGDLVAIVMLTVVALMSATGRGDSHEVLGAILKLHAVIVALLVSALLLLPRWLDRVQRASSEIGALLIAGMLLSMAFFSAKAGFSSALGAFLFGTIVATTLKNPSVNHSLRSLSQIFGPVFFVAMGMMLDARILLENWPLMLGTLALGFLFRTLAATAALLMTGHSVNDAIRSAFCLLPLGEFSLLLAFTGVQSGLAPESFYAAAFGLSLFTSVATPFLMPRSQRFGRWLERKQPRAAIHLFGFYREWVEYLKLRQNASILWRLTTPRLVQTSILVLFVSGLIIFASPLYFWTRKWTGLNWQFEHAVSILFWSIFLILVLAPLVAIWRQIESLAMICAETAIKTRSARTLLRPLFAKLLHSITFIAVLLWFASLLPYEAISPEALIVLILAISIAATLFWRRLVRVQSRFELELRAQLAESPFVTGKPEIPGWPKRNGHLNMALREVTLDPAAYPAARRIAELPLRAEFSSTIVQIDRQGVILPNPGPDSRLYPNDKLLLLGTEANLQAAEEWLNRPPGANPVKDDVTVAELGLGRLRVPGGSRYAGKALSELGIGSLFGLQVVGIERGDQSLLVPGPKENLAPGDQLLVLGTPQQFSELAVWLSN